MPRLIHLNGPPGIGKSTIARRYADEHPGTLDCDIDVLRALIGGWRERPDESAASIRTAALALITSYLGGGRDVIVPQLVARPDQLERFEAAAEGTGAEFVEVVRYLTSHRDVARRLGTNGLRYVEREYRWEGVMQKVERLLNIENGQSQK